MSTVEYIKSIVTKKYPHELKNPTLEGNWLNYVINYDHIFNFCLNESQWQEIISYSNAETIHIYLDNNTNVPATVLTQIIKSSDCSKKDIHGYTPLAKVLRFNKERNFKLSAENINDLIYAVNTYDRCSDGSSTAMIAAKYNKKNNLNLDTAQLDYLIKNSYLEHIDDAGFNLATTVFDNHKNLDLTLEQLDYLVRNSNLNKKSMTALLKLAIKIFKYEDLAPSTWSHLVKKSAKINKIEALDKNLEGLIFPPRKNYFKLNIFKRILSDSMGDMSHRAELLKIKEMIEIYPDLSVDISVTNLHKRFLSDLTAQCRADYKVLRITGRGSSVLLESVRILGKNVEDTIKEHEKYLIKDALITNRYLKSLT